MTKLTAEQALSRLPDGDKVHTFLDMFGADWNRDKIVESIKGAVCIHESGPYMTAMGHGIAIPHPENATKTLFIETVRQDEGDESEAGL